MKKVAFFDIDDTLLDNTKAHRKSARNLRKLFFPNASQKEFERIWEEKLKENWKLFTGGKISFKEQRVRRITSIWKHFGKKIGMKQIENVILIHTKFYEAGWKLMPGVKKNLMALKKRGFRLGIVSNGNWDQQSRKLKKVGVYDFFEEELIFISAKVGFSKPDLRIFKHAQKTADVSSKEIVFFGNEIVQDFEPGKKMGWETVLINSPKVFPKWVADLVKI